MKKGFKDEKNIPFMLENDCQGLSTERERNRKVGGDVENKKGLDSIVRVK